MAKMEGSDVLSHASLLVIDLEASTALIGLVHVREQKYGIDNRQLTVGACCLVGSQVSLAIRTFPIPTLGHMS